MAHTEINDAESFQKHYDSAQVLSEKLGRLALMMRDSRHFVTFTAAGISTSAGIDDFLGREGEWTREAKGLQPLKGVSFVGAYPARTHMELWELQRHGVLKYLDLISQNCDGLHRRSGTPAAATSELHGNGCVEICEDCGLEHLGDLKSDRRAKEARNPDYGALMCEYCIDAVVRNENCDLKTAADIIDKRFAACRSEALAEAGKPSVAAGYGRKPSQARGW